jgi:hypothetical protein
MLTCNRPDFAMQGIRYFQRQDYRAAELIIIEAGAERLSRFLPKDPRIRLLHPLSFGNSGSLMNIACAEARGNIIIHWNDFDWYGPQRISRQISPIQAGVAGASALFDPIVFDHFQWQFRRWGPRFPKESLLEILASTLAFKRYVWQRLAHYPDDAPEPVAAFLKETLRRGVRLQHVRADGVLIRLRRPITRQGVRATELAASHPVVEPALPAVDRAFYARRSLAPPRAPLVPMVSCIMPTRDRRQFVRRAIEYFDRQDYPSKELIIIDDGRDTVDDLAARHPEVRYYRYRSRTVLGTKRNRACELASGEFIAHVDDDDWYAHDHLSILIGGLLTSGADIGGVRALPFIDPETGEAWIYRWPTTRRIWAAGNSLGYRKSLWVRSRFPPLDKAEDTAFVWSAAVRSMCDISDAGTIIAIIHSGNTVRKRVSGAYWHPVPVADLKYILGEDFPYPPKL